MSPEQKERPQKVSLSGNKEKLVPVVEREDLTDHLTPTSLLPSFAFSDVAIIFVRSFSYFNDIFPVFNVCIIRHFKSISFLNQKLLFIISRKKLFKMVEYYGCFSVEYTYK